MIYCFNKEAGGAAPFLVYGCSSLVGAVVLHCSLPETRGLSPEEVARQFHTRYTRSRRPRRHSRRQPEQTSGGGNVGWVTLRYGCGNVYLF